MKKSNLRLNLKKEWYNMIDSGIKTEEYREIKPFWIKRLTEDNTIENLNFKHFDEVTFVYGYTSKTMTFEIKNISIGKGKPEWGGNDNDVFIIKLGKRNEDFYNENGR